jgi:hypothetical protein
MRIHGIHITMFPVSALDGVNSAFDWWTPQIVNRSSDEIRERLTREWTRSELPGWKAFVDRMLSLNVGGITVFRGIPYIVLSSENGSVWFVPPPPDDDVIRSIASQSVFATCKEYLEFLRCFSGVAEVPENLGEFPNVVADGGIETLGSSDPDAENRFGKKWADSAVVFHSVSGDLLCLRPDGKVGWSVMDDPAQIKEIGKTFDECLLWLSKVIGNNDLPLDSYSDVSGSAD